MISVALKIISFNRCSPGDKVRAPALFYHRLNARRDVARLKENGISIYTGPGGDDRGEKK